MCHEERDEVFALLDELGARPVDVAAELTDARAAAPGPAASVGLLAEAVAPGRSTSGCGPSRVAPGSTAVHDPGSPARPRPAQPEERRTDHGDRRRDHRSSLIAAIEIVGIIRIVGQNARADGSASAEARSALGHLELARIGERGRAGGSAAAAIASR